MIIISQQTLDAMAEEAKRRGDPDPTLIQECPKPMTAEDYMHRRDIRRP